jgi:carboxypeptidase family protein
MAGESRVARGDTYVKKLGWIAVILGLLVAAGAPMQAQMRGLGRINGSIADDGGAVVADAVVKITFSDGSKIEGKSDAKGNWALAGLGRGEFPVSFEKDGFEVKRVKVVIEKELAKTQPIKITMKKGA